MRFFFLLIFCSSCISFAEEIQRRIPFDMTEEREGLIYIKGEDQPFSGLIVTATVGSEENSEGLDPEFEDSVLNGQYHGSQRTYFLNGGLSVEEFMSCGKKEGPYRSCLLYTSPSPRDKRQSRMPSSA